MSIEKAMLTDNSTPGEPTTETAITNEVPDGNDNYVPTFNAATSGRIWFPVW